MIRPREPSILMIFGYTGDFSRHKLLPALARLAGGSLPKKCHVLAVAAGQKRSQESFRSRARGAVTGSALNLDPEADRTRIVVEKPLGHDLASARNLGECSTPHSARSR